MLHRSEALLRSLPDRQLHGDKRGDDMSYKQLLLITAVTLVIAIATPAGAEIVRTQVRVSLPANGTFGIDADGDGIADFTITSKFLQPYCSGGDSYMWTVTAASSAGGAVISDTRQASSALAAALLTGFQIGASQSFATSPALMAEMYWGRCGVGVAGEWLNLPNRYLGLKFYSSDHTVHYGWAKLSTAAYVDSSGNFHSNTMISEFAYETMAGHSILAGQTAETP
jgi:hypothetical protein